MSQLTLQLPEEVLNCLQREAERRHVQLDDVVLDAIRSYFNEDEPSQEELLDDLRQSMTDALAGRTHPAERLIDELRRKYPADDHYSGLCPDH